jgi:hypothetical protein
MAVKMFLNLTQYFITIKTEAREHIEVDLAGPRLQFSAKNRKAVMTVFLAKYIYDVIIYLKMSLVVAIMS